VAKVVNFIGHGWIQNRLEDRMTPPEPRDPHHNLYPAVELRGVTKMFTLASGEKLTAVNDMTLTIERGEFVCVLGPSGHGKSTVLNLIAGFIQPTNGTVLAHGDLVKGPGADRGVIFQRDTLFLWKRVAANVGYGLKARGVPKAEREEIVSRYLDIVGLTRFAKAWPKQLSGGMRRRAAIAAVFANEPDVLLMDEPFVGLDFARRAVLHQVLIELWSRAQNTIFFVTHDLDEALALASRVLVVVNGTIVHEAKIDRPRPRDAEALLSAEINAVRLAVLEKLEAAMADVDETIRFAPAAA
jgi:NitT/TauT family transport system ATP-binding protein